jgi:hypothetical protein
VNYFPFDLQIIYSAVCLRVYSLFQSESPQSAITSVPFQFPVSSRCLKIIQWLLTSSSSYSPHYKLSSIFSSVACFRRQFLCKMWPIQLAALFITSKIFLSSLNLREPYFRFINSWITTPTYFYICPLSDCCAENRLHGNLHCWLLIISYGSRKFRNVRLTLINRWSLCFLLLRIDWLIAILSAQ